MSNSNILKVRALDHIRLLSKLTGVGVGSIRDLNDFKIIIDDHTDFSLPCSFESMITLDVKVPIVNNILFPPSKRNVLLDFLYEADLESVYLIQDAYLTGPESLFLVTSTCRPVSILSRWMDLLKTSNLIVGEVDTTEESDPVCIVAAPLKSFL